MCEQTILMKRQKEVFVYNRELLSPVSAGGTKPNIPKLPSPAIFSPPNPPEAIKDETKLEEWQKLFKARRTWAIQLSTACEELLSEAENLDAEIIVVQRATAIAIENVKQHVGSLHQKYEEARSWGSNALREYSILLNDWEACMRRLSSIPAKREVFPLFYQAEKSLSRSIGYEKNSTLAECLEIDQLQKATSISNGASKRLKNMLSELTVAYEDILRRSAALEENFSSAFALPESHVIESSKGFLEEIEAIVKKISFDYENILSLPNTPKSVAAVSKTALLHSRNFLPLLMETATDAGALLTKTVDRKNNTMQTALDFLRTISTIESALAGFQPKLAALDIGVDEGNALEILGSPQQVPMIYGSILIELVRRNEWDENMRTDSSTLAEEMGVHKDEEERRRKRWIKTMSGHLNIEKLDSRALGIEVNLKSPDNTWPRITRDDINQYLVDLQKMEGQEDVLKGLTEALKGLDAPTKQQVRRTNAFKNGSVHEAAFGRNSLLLRGDDELLRSLQSEKSKLEDRLKGSESRIRKLEDLLHRQSQVSKPTGGNPLGSTNVPAPERFATSPVLNHASSSPKAPEILSRRSSVSSRRFSANHGAEEKALAQRVVKLEAEISSEKAKSAQLQTDLAYHARDHEDLKKQVEEIASTKKDLMDNFEAQQHEFDGERRLFEDENSKLKLRLEELEEELDRVLGSHDAAKVSIDGRTRNLELEVDKVRKEATEEVQKAQGQIDFLRSDYVMQRERAHKFERQLQQQGEEKAAIEAQVYNLKLEIKYRDSLQQDHSRALKAAHLQLADDDSRPDDFPSLVEAIEILAERSTARMQELKQALESTRIENALAGNRAKGYVQDINVLNKQMMAREQEFSSLSDECAEHKAHVRTLRTEIDDEHKQLESLRAKIAIGETGSGLLRSRCAEEERKVEDLSTRLGASNAYTEQLETEMRTLSSDIASLETDRKTLVSRLEGRAQRAEELSTILFNHTGRLSRLLEHVGFTITKQEDGMVVQKTPRTTSASTMLTDQSQSMARSASAPLPTKYEDSIPPDHIRWAMADDLKSETSSYEAFVREVQKFNMDTFTEAIIKRIKDSEHTARKWQREAKAYREKSHRAQLEAHEKIAYRSFKDGDLALFLPTRNQATRPWAAFNVGAPHYFLREQDSHRLQTRDWLLARISKVEERVVDLSKSMTGIGSVNVRRRNSIASASDGGASFDDENPFELSDGLRWYLLDAAEEKPGAPTTPGLGKSTVASAIVDAKGSIQRKVEISKESRATKTLTKSLDSRRSSSGSKKSLIGATTSPLNPNTASVAIQEGIVQASSSHEQACDSVSRPTSSSANKLPDADEVRKHLLWGP
ncbi:oligomeric, coiled-coil, peripheral membrane protein [Ptychographa xylographoides]|nr:oligomeric, coiled-coil, peripheral membrane protein [Ptychographa xylographoides]